MDLFQNEILEEKNKNKKKTRLIVIAASLILILCFVILGVIAYLQSLQLKISLDGVSTSFSEDTLIIEENGEVYVSISDIAKSLGYTYFKGEYGQASEEATQGYVQNENEVAMFEANSKKIYKTGLQNNSSSEYSYFYLTEPVRYINGKLYTTPEGIKIGFNTSFTYDQSTNQITIFTLPYLVNYYTTAIVQYDYQAIDSTFNNQKAILSDMIVAQNASGKYGVIDTSGKEIIGAKYDAITYDEMSEDFFVKSNNKNGLVDKQGNTKISLSYDSIKVLDKDSQLYIVQNSGKSGVVNRNGDTIIFLEYDKIGIDSSLYKDTDIKNPYLLFDNCIPVQRNNKWNLLDKNGNNILPTQMQDLDGIGCVVGTSTTSSANNLLIVPDYEAIVVMKDKKYGLVNSVGQELIACGLDNIYSITSNGQTTYQMQYMGQILDVEDYLAAHGISKVDPNQGMTGNGSDVNVTQDQNVVNETNTTTENQTQENQLVVGNETDNQEMQPSEQSSEEQQTGEQQ